MYQFLRFASLVIGGITASFAGTVLLIENRLEKGAGPIVLGIAIAAVLILLYRATEPRPTNRWPGRVYPIA